MPSPDDNLLSRPADDTVAALSQALERKDRRTVEHGRRVAGYSLRIVAELDRALTNREIECLRLAATLHDVGKMGIEDSILKKPSALNAGEVEIMRSHPELGHRILAASLLAQEVIDGMRFHHERWDGGGYPLGLQGTRIPLAARIIAVADAYDAMVSARPYRREMDPRLARQEILRAGGAQFDPEVVEAFARAFALAEA